jgi:hypothetical protein
MMDAPSMTASSSGAGPPIAPGRSCSKCSLCCKLLHVIELEKPANQWCGHCRPGAGGCTIYETRPPICRSYACGWLMTENVGPEWFPLLSHMILSLAPFNGVNTVTVTVDPRYPWIWKEYPYYAQLKQMADRGLQNLKSAEDILLVHVRCDGRVWLIAPNEDIEITNGSYVIKAGADGHYAIEQFATSEQAAVRVAELI